MGWRRRIFEAGHRSGALALLGGWYGPRRLTVLAYHRVIDRTAPGFDTYRRNVSTTPEGFAQQMAYVAERYSVIGLDRLLAWLDGSADLPTRPLLLTFDDGYRDNLVHALPVLRSHGFPAVVFLATGAIDTGEPLHWDLAAYCFSHTDRQEALLPVIGRRRWRTDGEREGTLDEFIEAIKRLPDGQLRTAVARLPDQLDVQPPDDAFAGVYLRWSEVSEMADQGVAFGAHTVDHPILARLGPEEAAAQVLGSRERVAEALGRPVPAFAYPNGLAGDFDRGVVDIVRRAGFSAAFTLVPGPARVGEVRRAPLEIRRIYVGSKDHISRFAAKLGGLGRTGRLLR